MLQFITGKSSNKFAYQRSELNLLTTKTGEILKEINQLRLTNSSPILKLVELRGLTAIYNLKCPALLIYIQQCFALMRYEVIATLEYIFENDSSFLNELLNYEFELTLVACRSNNPQLFDFILSKMKSHADGANIIYNIVRNNSMTLLEHVLEQGRFPVTAELSSKLQSYREYLCREAHQLNNIALFDWVYNLYGKEDEQGTTLSKVCYSGGFELLRHLIQVKKYNINAQMRDGSTALMSTVILLRSQMNSYQLDRRKKIINYLIDNNADFFIERHDGRNVFHIATQVDDTITLCALDAKLKANKLNALKDKLPPGTPIPKIETQLKSILYNGNETLLHVAIVTKAPKTVLLLSRLFDTNILDSYGLNLACFALNANCPDVAENLLNEFPHLDIRGTDGQGINILHRCAADGSRLESAKWLIEKKNFPLEDRTIAGDTALLVAAISKNTTIISYLLWESKRKPNISAVNNGRYHIGHYIAEFDDIELAVKFIYDRKYHPDFLAQNIDGENMLDKALLKGESHYPVVKAGLLRIQSENKYIKKSASIAIRRKKFLPLYLKFLEHCKKNTDPYDILTIGDWIFGGQTPLHLLTAEFSVVEMEQHIDDFELDINALNRSGQNVIAYLVGLGKTTKAQNFITKFRPNVVNIDKHGSSVLHLAVERDNLAFLTWCLANLELNLFDKRFKDDNSPLDLAYFLDNKQAAYLLWSRLTDKQQFDYFFSSTLPIQEFIKQNLSYDPFNINGVNLLHIAVRNADLELTAACVATGQFSILEKNKNSRNALDIATNKQNSAITRLLFNNLSLTQQLEYFRSASDSKQEFFTSQEIYNPTSDKLLDVIAESITQEVLDELPNPYLKIADVALSEEHISEDQRRNTQEGMVDRTIEEVFAEVADELIVETHQREHVKLLMDKQSLTTSFSTVHSQLEKSASKKEAEKTASSLVVELVEEVLDNVFADEMRIAQAVIDRDYNFFSELEDDEASHALLAAQASNIINLAILRGYSRFTKFILDFQLISAQANVEHLYQARYSNQKDIEKILRELPSVQQSTPTRRVEFKATESEGILCKPECMKNPVCAIALEELGNELSDPEFAELKALLYGSGNINEKPGDLDILFPQINCIELEDLVQRFIDKLVNTRGASLVVRANNKSPFASPVKSPKTRTLRVIPIEWLGCRFEFIITPLTKEQHSRGLDYTIYALYYDVVAKQMYEIEGINARADFMNGILNTILPAEESYQDLRRIFRGIKLMSLMPRFMFSIDCYTVIYRMFSSDSNPFMTNDMPVDQLIRLINDIYGPHHNKLGNLFHLSGLNILPHVIDFLRKKPGKYNAKIADTLEREQPVFYQPMLIPQATPCYELPDTHTQRYAQSSKRKSKRKDYVAKPSERGVFSMTRYVKESRGLKAQAQAQAQEFVSASINFKMKK